MSTRKDKSQKVDKPRPAPPENGCHFYVERKHRYCRFKPAKDAQYCAEHATLFGADLGRERVHCPYNAKHTCYADKIKHHMKKCPSRPKEMPAYYSAGLNTGDNAGETVPDPKETVLTVPVDELEIIIDKVNKLYEEHIGALPEEILSHPCMREELENSSYGTAAIRHRKQQASLIGQMEKLGLLTDHRCFLEMGAGKGQLSHWLHGAVEKKKDIGFVLIDRSHVRNKMDNLHKEEMIMERIRIDIEHLKLEKVSSIEKNDRSVVAFGKHLCGPATDLALRCVTETLSSSLGTSDDIDGEGRRKRLKSETRCLGGAVIALCCHHRCAWTPYVGKSFFKSCGLSARDFQVVSSMSSWATCAWKGWSFQRKMESQKLKDSESEGQMVTDNIEGHTIIDTVKGQKVKEIEIQNEDQKFMDTLRENAGKTDNQEISVQSTSESSVKESEDNVQIINVKDTQVQSGVKDTQVQSGVKDTQAQSGVKDTQVQSGAENKQAQTEGKGTPTERSMSDGEEDEHCHEEATTTSGINSKLSQEEREVIGRKCKRLIDHGRVQYLQEHGMKSSLKTYIEEFYTPENVVLVATS